MSGLLAREQSLSADPILNAAARYRGTLVDLDSGRSVSADDFARLRETLLHDLTAFGLQAGDRVILTIPNGAPFIVALLTLLEAGACPLLLHFKTPSTEVFRYAKQFACRYSIGDFRADRFENGNVTNFSQLECNGTNLQWCEFDNDRPSDSGFCGVPLHPTSGSTGLPKIALRPGFAAIEEARHYAETMDIRSTDGIVAFPPMSHAYGYGMSVMVPLLTGANVLTTQRFSVEKLRAAMGNHVVSVLPVVPSMLPALSMAREMRWDRMRWVLAAGSVLPHNVAAMFLERTGVTCCPLYGTTETGGISVATTADGSDVDGRVGPAMKGVETSIIPETDLGPNIGRLAIRSSSMMAGYLDEHGNIARPFSEAWFSTGDLALMSDSESVHLRGRVSDVINVHGMKVVPSEVEEVLLRMPDIHEVKVYAGVGKYETQTVLAAVATERRTEVRDIEAFCQDQLVYYKRPYSIHVIDALPRNPAGKIITTQLPGINF
jgi:acyl-CoA synthetase (AMP-forming)/AMP-acid ligase II